MPGLARMAGPRARLRSAANVALFLAESFPLILHCAGSRETAELPGENGAIGYWAVQDRGIVLGTIVRRFA